MSNKYWEKCVKIPHPIFGEKIVPIGKPKCSLTHKWCLYPEGYCSQCPIEYEDASYEEALAEKVLGR
jgi:hypothetical protein